MNRWVRKSSNSKWEMRRKRRKKRERDEITMLCWYNETKRKKNTIYTFFQKQKNNMHKFHYAQRAKKVPYNNMVVGSSTGDT
mmetsp:Transcript_30796/g.52589  ORF Transcript_30796/g.52589 Transcript_30796/m.52589 type:complete len:82 (+) Transcript_30796:107-352(+)